MSGEDGMAAAIDKAEHIVLGNFLAKPDATRAEDAAFVIECNSGPKLHRFRFLDLVLQKPRFGLSVFDTELLESAFARLIANRAVEWMIDQQEFHYPALTFPD